MVFFLLLFQEAKQIASGFHVAEEDRAALGEAGKDASVQFDKVRTPQHGWGAQRRLGHLYVEVEHIIRPVMIPS
jgi:hypothetical protein